MNAYMLEQNLSEAALLLKAMANRHRLQIMLALQEGEKCVGDLEDIVGLSQSALSQHLARMRRDNLVATRRDAQTIFYSLSCPGINMIMDALSGWFQTSQICSMPAKEVVDAVSLGHTKQAIN